MEEPTKTLTIHVKVADRIAAVADRLTANPHLRVLVMEPELFEAIEPTFKKLKQQHDQVGYLTRLAAGYGRSVNAPAPVAAPLPQPAHITSRSAELIVPLDHPVRRPAPPPAQPTTPTATQVPGLSPGGRLPHPFGRDLDLFTRHLNALPDTSVQVLVEGAPELAVCLLSRNGVVRWQEGVAPAGVETTKVMFARPSILMAVLEGNFSLSWLQTGAVQTDNLDLLLALARSLRTEELHLARMPKEPGADQA